MTDQNTDLKNCPACADYRMSLQEHSGWYWVTCATCHYRGPAMRDVVSAVAEYNAQRDIIAQYLVSRSDLAAVTTERDALKKRVADAPRITVFEMDGELCHSRPEPRDWRAIPKLIEHGDIVAWVRLEDGEK